MRATKSAFVCFVVVLLAGCDASSSHPNTSGDIGFRPSAAAQLQMTVAGPLGVTSSACIPGNSFTPSLTLVITPQPSFNASIDSVTFHLIDGSAGGGSSITFPRPQLTQLFGTTVIVGTRSFPFVPPFVCPQVSLRAIDADVLLDDGRQLTASVTLGR
jgi:hypothetical protein